MSGRSRRRPTQQEVCGPTGEYEVQRGDTLWGIAEATTGDGRNWRDLAAANPQIEDPNLILPGQVLDVQGLCEAGTGEEGTGEEGAESEQGGDGQTTGPPPVDPVPPTEPEGDSEVEPEDTQPQQTGPEEGTGDTPPPDDGGGSTPPPPPSPAEGEHPSGPEPSGGTNTTGNDAVDQHLDTCSTNDALDACCEPDWIDDLNQFRNHPMGKAGINVVERLIPIYGMWDATRDNWNTMIDTAERAPHDLIVDMILGAQFVVGTVADIIRHLAYLFGLVQWIAAATGIGAVPATIGGYSIGLVANIVLAILDAVNAVLGLVGASYAGLMLAFADLDDEERARYEFFAVHEVEHAIVSGVHVVVDGVAALLGNYLPSAVTSETLKNALPALLPMAATGTRGLAVGLVRWAFDVPEDFGEPPPPRVDTGLQLPRDIVADTTYVVTHPLGPGGPFFLYGGSEDAYDRLMSGRVRECADSRTQVPEILARATATEGSQPAAPQIPPTDHSPAQVDVLDHAEQTGTAALQQTETNMSELQTHRENQAQVVAATESAETVFTGMSEAYASSATDLSAALPGVGEGLARAQEAGGGVSEFLGHVGTLTGHLTGIGNWASTPVQEPPQEEQSWLESAVNWVVENTIGRVFSQLTSGMGELGGSAGTGLSGLTDTGGQGTGAQGLIGQDQQQFQQAQAEGQEALAGAETGQASTEAARAELEPKRASAEQEVANADQGLQEQEAQRARIEAWLEEIRAERERQQSENTAFATQYGPVLEQQGQGEGPTLQPQHVDGLVEALDVVMQASDAAVAQAMSRATSLRSDDQREAAVGLVQGFQDHQAVVLAELMGTVNGVSPGSAAFDAFRAAEAMLLGVELAIYQALDDLLAAIEGLEASAEAAEQQGAEQGAGEQGAAANAAVG